VTYRDVGYARLSHYDPDQKGAIARQSQDIRRLSADTGGELVTVENSKGELTDILVDNAISASAYARRKRKDYPRLLELAEAGAVDRGIIYDVDRLLRIPDELEDLIKLVDRLRGRFTIVSLHGRLDLTTAEGRKYARGRVADAAYESERMSERLRRAFVQKAEQGQPHAATGKSRAFGYEDDGLTVDLVEATLLRTAAADVLAGETLGSICRRWNTTGITTPKGGPWEHRALTKVLVGRRQAGLRVYHEGADDERVFPAAWPAIIDEVTHRALRRKFIENSARLPGRRTEFTGLFVAPVDGRVWKMRRDRKPGRAIYRTMRDHPGVPTPSISIGPADQLEELVREWLFVHVESGGLARRVALRREASATRPVGEDPSVVRDELVQLAEDKADGAITRPEWLAMRKRLTERLRAAEAAATNAAPGGPLAGVDVDVRARWALPEDDGGYTVDRKRAILAGVFDRIEITRATRGGPGFDPSRVTPIWVD
jgi:DNA invertase Pin-like site-specific DNA recombinase